ncbi:hypothetical protein [Rubeoparvulum massiliense]|uniref:hypothetical protein n=1 Tax=Rubeoparvulum massiliense TaxID=1631346 RepID=UPI00065E1908|nr:hypothetical protein [Rubeoparvulum massiliense]
MVEFLEQYYVFIIFAVLALLVLKMVTKLVMAIIIIVVGFAITFYAYDEYIKPTAEDVFAYYQSELHMNESIVNATKNAYHVVKEHADKIKIEKDGFRFTGKNISGKVGSEQGLYLDITADKSDPESLKTFFTIIKTLDSSPELQDGVTKLLQSTTDARAELPQGFIEVKGNDIRVYRQFK